MYNTKVPNMLKPTILTAKHYDTKVSVEFEYSDVSLDEIMDGFETLLMGMGFRADGFKQWVIDKADEYMDDDIRNGNIMVDSYVDNLSEEDIDAALAQHNFEEDDNNYNDYGQLTNNTTYKV